MNVGALTGRGRLVVGEPGHRFEWTRSLDTTYVMPLARGFCGLLLSDAQTTGLLAVMPALALALWEAPHPGVMGSDWPG